MIWHSSASSSRVSLPTVRRMWCRRRTRSSVVRLGTAFVRMAPLRAAFATAGSSMALPTKKLARASTKGCVRTSKMVLSTLGNSKTASNVSGIPSGSPERKDGSVPVRSSERALRSWAFVDSLAVPPRASTPSFTNLATSIASPMACDAASQLAATSVLIASWANIVRVRLVRSASRSHSSCRSFVVGLRYSSTPGNNCWLAAPPPRNKSPSKIASITFSVLTGTGTDTPNVF